MSKAVKYFEVTGLKSAGEHKDIYHIGPLFADIFCFLFFFLSLG